MSNLIPNEQLGHIPLELEGFEKPVVLKFSLNSLCAVEQALKRPFTEVGAEMQLSAATGRLPSYEVMRALFWGGLLETMPSITLERAGAMLSRVKADGIKAQCMTALGALARAFEPLLSEEEKKTIREATEKIQALEATSPESSGTASGDSATGTSD